MISFVDDGLFVSQSKSILHSNTNLFCSYNITSFILLKYSLIIEHGKTDIFHFSRLHGTFNPSPLDLTLISGPSLLLKETWKYLDFIFNCKLTFRNYIDFYFNKVILTIKCCSETQPEVLILFKREDCIDVVPFLLYYIDSNYSTTTKHLHTITSTSWGRCNEELLYRLLEPFKYLLLWVLKL